jgi:hypothetical protein
MTLCDGIADSANSTAVCSWNQDLPPVAASSWCRDLRDCGIVEHASSLTELIHLHATHGQPPSGTLSIPAVADISEAQAAIINLTATLAERIESERCETCPYPPKRPVDSVVALVVGSQTTVLEAAKRRRLARQTRAKKIERELQAEHRHRVIGGRVSV